MIIECEIYYRCVKRKIRCSNISNVECLKDYNEFLVGDYVVYNVYGVGKFLGIEIIEI